MNYKTVIHPSRRCLLRRITWGLLLGAVIAWGITSPVTSAAASGDAIMVVVSRDFPLDTLTRQQVHNIFMGRTRFIGKVKLVPLDYVDSVPARVPFLKQVLGLQPAEFQKHWIRAAFRTGALPPRKTASVEDMRLLLHSKRGAIGYMRSGELNGDRTLRVVLRSNG